MVEVDLIILQTTAAVTAALVALTSVCFYNIRRSRCIECSSWCFSAKRQLMTPSEMADDILSLS